MGIEDILFTSDWVNYKEESVHHQDEIVDYGWNTLQFKYVENAWIRNGEFKDWNQVADIRESIAVTINTAFYQAKEVTPLSLPAEIMACL